MLRCIFDAIHATMCRRDSLLEIQVADGLVASFPQSSHSVDVLLFQRIVHMSFRSLDDPMSKGTNCKQLFDQKLSRMSTLMDSQRMMCWVNHA